MRLLLVSTYELGRQPVHLGSPAAALRAAGHSVATLDLAVETYSDAALADVEAVAISVPMHTAMRLAATVAGRIRASRPDLPLAFYGLYAAVGKDHTLGGLADRLIAGEYERGLIDWAETAAVGRGLSIDRSPSAFRTPDRSTLPPPDSYARLEWEGKAKVAGAVEASHGCRHRCRHCPIPVLYDGRLRVVGIDAVLGDIDQLVAAGVGHVTFGDPDFLNAPRYSSEILREAHGRHPEISFDVTVKVTHVLEHREIWPEWAELGLLFVVSAFESVDQDTLDVLDKGHTVEDMRLATQLLGDAGVHVRPTWLPFMPWTRAEDLVHLVDFLDEMRLWEATDPVQLAIKLLIPENSLLEKHPRVEPYLKRYVPGAFTWEWDFDFEQVGSIHKQLDAIAAAGSDCGDEALATLDRMRKAIGSMTGVEFGELPTGRPRPRLSESWFCCAEPTEAQLAANGIAISLAPHLPVRER